MSSEGGLLGCKFLGVNNVELDSLLGHPFLNPDCHVANYDLVDTATEGLVQSVIKAAHSAHAFYCVDLLRLVPFRY